MNAKAPIQIIGAGLTGMSAAHTLGEGFEIHEALGHAGGHAITLEDDGFRFDRTGHLLHLRDPEIRSWVLGLLGPDVVTVQRKSFVFSHGVYTRYPYQANTYGLPPAIAYECLTDYLEAMREQANVPEPHNFEEFCLKHFGKGFSKHFMIPYNQKLWGVHPREITAAWCSRFVPLPKLEDVIAGAVGLNDRELGYNANFVYPRLGIGELSKALALPLQSKIQFQHRLENVDWRNKTLQVGTETRAYRALISTAPLNVLVRQLVDAPEEVRRAGEKLWCNPLWYLDVALDVPCGIDLHWAYVPEEKYPFYRVGCYSHFSSSMAPPDKAGLYVELSSRETPDLAKLLPEVAQGLIDMRIIERAEQIRFARTRKIDHAYVVFDHNYYAAVEKIHPFLEENAIFAAGRYGNWNYSSMEDALLFGQKAAKQAQSSL